MGVTMAPSSAADRDLASALDPVSVHTSDLRHRRRALRPAAEAARGRRVNLDSLAIGAPLTAAFVGALLTEPGAAARHGHDPDAAVSAGAGRPGRRFGDGRRDRRWRLWSGARAGRDDRRPGSPANQRTALDPVSVDGVPAALAVAHEGGAGASAGATASEAAAGPARPRRPPARST